MIPCMGGWCTKREKCPHFHATGQEPAERLCVPGKDGELLRDLESGVTMPVVSYRIARAPEVAA